MATGSFTKGLRRFLSQSLLVALSTLGAFGATPKRVLILDSFGRDIAPFNATASAFRTTLALELGEPVDIFEASLDAARFVEPEEEGPFVEFLKSRFESRQLDLVVPVGTPAVRFMAKYRESLFASTPIVFMATEPRLIPPALLQTNATLVTQRVNIPGMVKDILQLQPDTTNVVVVLGASLLEKFWVSQCRNEFRAFTNRINFTWMDDLSLEQMEQRVANLPPHSFVLFGMLVMDASGVPYDGNAPLQRLHVISKSPIFAYFSSQFGSGAIGGRLYQETEVGTRAARAAIRILRGERPESIAPQILEAATPVYDARELRRWNIPEARLPVGSVVHFQQPSFWENYRWRILGVAALCLVQTGLIVALLLNRAQRRRAEAQAHRQQEELAHISRVSTLGELATSVAHELNQPLGAILSNAEAAELFLKQDPPPLGEIQAILADIRKDDERAGEVIRRMRTLLRKNTLERQPLEISSVATEVLRLISAKAADSKTTVISEFSPHLPPVSGDRIQLQQVLLNLILNAVDAMAEQPSEKRSIVVRVNPNGDNTVELSVQDSGPGIDPTRLPRLFEPFFTTKQSGIGMGLTICRRIVEAHHGRIWAENHLAGGAIFRVTLPAVTEQLKS